MFVTMVQINNVILCYFLFFLLFKFLNFLNFDDLIVD